MVITTSRRSAAARRTEPTSRGAEAGPDAARPGRTAAGYRTFSPKLAPALQALGGVLLAAGGLGLHLRATRTLSPSLPAEEALRVWGGSSAEGWLVAAAGVLAVAAAAVWGRRGIVPKAFAFAVAAAGIGLTIWRLRTLDATAAELVAGTEPSADFVAYHAGFGWGAWLALLGSVLLGLGVLAGVLRELDLRREARS